MIRRFINKLAVSLRQAQYAPIITVLVHRDDYLANLRALQTLAPQWQLAPVIKSNAYGHGLTMIAEIIESQKNIPLLCVDSYAEASILRNVGMKKPVLVLGHTPAGTISRGKLANVVFVVASFDELQKLTGTPARVHLKFDTGMHRQGISPSIYDEVAKIIKRSKCVVEGVLSHLADAETPGSVHTEKQIKIWNKLAEKFQKDFPAIRYYHLSNSAGLAHYSKINGNLARPGIATYGLNPGNLPVTLKPVLEMRAVISEIRDLEPGESVGYNATFTATKPMRIATVPCGYYEGVDRRLSNKGCFGVEQKTEQKSPRGNGLAERLDSLPLGKSERGEPRTFPRGAFCYAFAPIIGRVSMNITSCDVTNIPEAEIGTPVTIISNNPEDPNSAENIAKLIGTISYEIVTRIPASLRREVV